MRCVARTRKAVCGDHKQPARQRLPLRSCPVPDRTGCLGLGLGRSLCAATLQPEQCRGAGGQPNTPLSCISCTEREEEEEGSRDLHSLRQRCLQALAAVSTHTSIVRETVPVLLQHLRKVQKGNAAGGSVQHRSAGDEEGRAVLPTPLCPVDGAIT